MLFLTRLQHLCNSHADKTALEFISPSDTCEVSYRQLEERVRLTMAYLLELGLRPGDRVALQLPKSLEFIYLHLATMRLGAISLPLNPAFPPPELVYFLSDSGAKLFFADSNTAADLRDALNGLPSLQQAIFLHLDSTDNFLQLIDTPDRQRADLPPVPADADLTALMIYTSGTTGRPKGAELTHGNLTANINALHTAWMWQENDILLHVLPIFHTHGLTVALHGALNAGATAILIPAFDPVQTLDLLTTRHCTVFMAVPTIHQRLLVAPNADEYDLSHMRLMTSGSARLPDDVFRAFQGTFGYTLLERYGMTETGMNLSNPFEGERRIGSVGKPLPGVEARIVHPETGVVLDDGQIGEVQIRGSHVFKCYWRQPQKTAEAFTEDGWLRTGDMGMREPDGYFILKGRSKDLIISGGFNVYPPEVELALADHPDVEASAVIGCPDSDWGERVVAVIVLRAGATVTEQNIIDFCRDRLAPYKSPKKVVFVESFPRNAMGKVQKAHLRTSLCSES